MVGRLQHAVRALDAEQRLAGLAALALTVTLFLPWYQVSVARGSAFFDSNRTAFGVFSFVEAAVLLVAAGVLALLFARGERKGFHLPGGDGTAIMLAGGWAVLLLVWRLFDTPESPDTEFGLQWGIFVALGVAGLLTAAGARVRAAHRPEPPNPAADDAGWEHPPPPERRPERRPREPTAVTEALRDRPGWEGEPPDAPGRAERREPPDSDRRF